MGPHLPDRLFQDWIGGAGIGDLTWDPASWIGDELLGVDGLITAPLVPLRDVVVFPNMVTPLFVGRERTIRAVNEANDADGWEDFRAVPQRCRECLGPQYLRPQSQCHRANAAGCFGR